MQVVHLSVECFPLAKVGGLADVVGALPRYQRDLGIDARVVCPFYERAFTAENRFDLVFEGAFSQGSEELCYQILKEQNEVLGFPLYLIRIPGKLDREEVYCYPDEAEQWIAFQHAFLDWVSSWMEKPDVINCHDHHVGLIPFLLKHGTAYQELVSVKTVFTVHNGQYQGVMDWSMAPLLPAFDTWKWGLLDWDGLISPLAAAIKCCDAFTTVSSGYLLELNQKANGLESLFRTESAKGQGIVNGIDDRYWNPELDSLISKNYKKTAFKSGKKSNKKTLCDKFGLDLSFPLIVFIGRFALEKGADLLPDIIEEVFSKPDYALSFFVLGSGDEGTEDRLQELLQKYPNRFSAFFGYNEALAHQVYAAADFLLMPSRVEPCGLNQLYAMKYGTIPIVRGTGGLKDTVLDVKDEQGYGFVFTEATVNDATEAISRALTVMEDNITVQKIRQKCMSQDFSWDRSAKQYINLYHQLID